MKRRILAIASIAVLGGLLLTAVAFGVKHGTIIDSARYQESSTGGYYVVGTISSPYHYCERNRTATASYTAVGGGQVSLSDAPDATGLFRMPSSGNLPQLAAGPVTVTVKKKKIFLSGKQHVCKKKSATAVLTPLP